eukprot:TRINITY_DN10017_c0_g1_i1.p1 TRINITY_DN10017_c0_g1~~TRINITY_DN10017_c0_g1_i1.p1  ORF type:complete len:159 (-),score=34.35 TRINITY_DN10017_c0_g1_i1:227-703(-)
MNCGNNYYEEHRDRFTINTPKLNSWVEIIIRFLNTNRTLAENIITPPKEPNSRKYKLPTKDIYPDIDYTFTEPIYIEIEVKPGGIEEKEIISSEENLTTKFDTEEEYLQNLENEMESKKGKSMILTKMKLTLDSTNFFKETYESRSTDKSKFLNINYE